MDVLVVDDEPRYREHLGRFLERLGLRPHLAATATEAQTIVQQRPLDLMIVDIRLADSIDGLDFADWARKLDRGLGLIVITGFSCPSYECRSRELGAIAYLEKPFELHELELHLRHMLDQRKLLREIHRLEQELAAAEGADPRRRVLSELPVTCLARDGRLLFATPEAHAVLAAVVDPDLPRPLDRVDAGLGAQLWQERRIPGGVVTVFRRDGTMGHFEARVHPCEWEGQEALVALWMEAAPSGAGGMDELWPGILVRAAQALRAPNT